ncbi:MAG: hypothetical protein JXL67_10405 [Calditrichaeota bacterium]|nr:hypothetical protein [Calditrichota bacterium]RQV92531.1 MAG: hypothetical protein EH221_11335 [bacterium]
MKSILLPFIILFSFISVVTAQSVFSGIENGIGLRHYVGTVRGIGMGGTGLASPDSISLNAYNSAMWHHISDTKISLSLRHSYVQTDLSGQELSSSTGNFNGLQLAIPIQKKKWVFGINIVPYSIANFSYILNRQSAGESYQENIFYEGNLARSQLNLVWAPVEGIGLAASLNYFFGDIRDRYYLFFEDAAISDIFYQIEYQLNGPGIGTSFDISLLEPFYLGGFIDFEPKITLTRITQNPISLEEQKEKISTNLPIFAGFGTSYRFKKQWTVSADVVYQDLSEALDQNQADNLESFYEVGAGIEHSRSRERTKAFMQKFDTRLGFSYGNLGYRYNDNSIREMAIHLGFGIPFFHGRARIDIGFKGGIRGDITENLVEEKFIKTFISLSAGELWYQKIR